MTTASRRQLERPLKGSVAQLPFHAQVREVLRASILDGSYLPDYQLPSENEMKALFAVSRITIRHALHDLQNEGLIYRIHGKGTYVSRPRATQDLMRLQSFGEAMRPQGYETCSRVISVREVMPPHPGIAEKLGTEPGEKVSEIKRLRFLNGDPVSFDVSWFMLDLGRRVAQQDLESNDIFVVLERDLGHCLHHADLVIGARPADDIQADLLHTASGAPLLFIDRVVSDANDRPVACEHLFHRGDAYHFHVRVERDQHAARER